MSYEKLRNIILEKAQELEFEVLDTQKKMGGYVISFRHAMILIQPDCHVEISFHVSTRPDLAAITTLMINEIDYVNTIAISDIFMFSEQKQLFLVGDIAVDKWEENKATNIISKYIREKTLTDWFNSCTRGPTA